MKSIKEILETPAIYLGKFDSIIDVISQFEDIYTSTTAYYNGNLTDQTRAEINGHLNGYYKDINIILATYDLESYEGYAYVLFERNGNLYEVDGSHCSCYGLEGQFSPEDVDMAELEHRLLEGTFGESSYSGYFKEELCEKLGVEYKENRGKY